MDKKIIEKLKQDEHYYGDYGKQFLSNSDISVLLKNPKLLHQKKRTYYSYGCRRLFSYSNTRT